MKTGKAELPQQPSGIIIRESPPGKIDVTQMDQVVFLLNEQANLLRELIAMLKKYMGEGA